MFDDPSNGNKIFTMRNLMIAWDVASPSEFGYLVFWEHELEDHGKHKTKLSQHFCQPRYSFFLKSPTGIVRCRVLIKYKYFFNTCLQAVINSMEYALCTLWVMLELCHVEAASRDV